MAETLLEIGTDKQIAITVTDANGDSLNLSGYEGYSVILYYEQDKTIIQKYSKNNVTGYNTDDIDTTNEATGVIAIDFQRSLSEAGRNGGRVFAQVIVQATDADYGSSQRREYSTFVYCFTFYDPALNTTVDFS